MSLPPDTPQQPTSAGGPDAVELLVLVARGALSVERLGDSVQRVDRQQRTTLRAAQRALRFEQLAPRGEKSCGREVALVEALAPLARDRSPATS